MTEKIIDWAVLGMEHEARRQAAFTKRTGSARTRMTEVLFYPRSKRIAYFTANGMGTKGSFRRALECEAKINGIG